MNASLFLRGSMTAALLACVWTAPAGAAQRAACSVLPLGDVRTIVGSAVAVGPGSFAPTARGNSTYSNCTYSVMGSGGHPAGGRGAKITLVWGPKDVLSKTNDFYTKRKKEAPGLRDGVLVLAWVGNPADGPAGDWAASQRLLAAVLKKL